VRSLHVLFWALFDPFFPLRNYENFVENNVNAFITLYALTFFFSNFGVRA